MQKWGHFNQGFSWDLLGFNQTRPGDSRIFNGNVMIAWECHMLKFSRNINFQTQVFRLPPDM
jgi:hypothetical protein